MRSNFGSDAVFQRCDDFAARGVILGIGSENEEHVERKAKRIAFNLNIALLHDVEEADLDFSGEVRKLVDGEDAAIAAWQKTIVDGEFVGEVASAAGRADGANIADAVGRASVRRADVLSEAVLT